MTDLTFMESERIGHVLVRAETERGIAMLGGIGPVRMPRVQAEGFALSATDAGLEVDRLDRTLPPVPEARQAVDAFREKYPELADRWRGVEPLDFSGQLMRRPAEVHTETLRRLRGQLQGEEKTAVRWALERISKLEERLAEIHQRSRA